MSGKLPWMKFYPADWSQDVAPLSLRSRGAWITILCAMWRSEKRGELSLPLIGFCRLLGASEAETTIVLQELDVTGIASRVTGADKKVTLMCRRMIREHNSYRNHALRQQRYRAAHQCDASVTGEKSEVRSQKSEVREDKRVPAARFVRPSPREVTEYAKSKNIDLDGNIFCDHYESNGWKVGRNPMKSWKAAVTGTWKDGTGKKQQSATRQPFPGEILKMLDELRAQRGIIYNRNEVNGVIPESPARKEWKELCRKIKELEQQVRRT